MAVGGRKQNITNMESSSESAFDRQSSINTVNPFFNLETDSSGSNHQSRRTRTSYLVLGNEIEVDEGLQYRVTLGQRLGAGFGIVSVLSFIVSDVFFNHQNIFMIIALCGAFSACLFGLGLIFYRNVSFAIIRRLLKEINVVVILCLIISDFIINIFKPHNWFSPINGLIYFLEIIIFVFLDAIIKKSRTFMLIASAIVAINTIFNMYMHTLGSSSVGVILFKYEFGGKHLEFRKRAIKRSIYTQLFCFCLSGIVTTLKDKKKEFMIFAKGNIYRDTGTSSKHVEDKAYVEETSKRHLESNNNMKKKKKRKIKTNTKKENEY